MSEKKKAATRIEPLGLWQSVRLFTLNDEAAKKLTGAQLASIFTGQPAFDPEKDPKAGFGNIEARGKTVMADFTAAFNVVAHGFDKSGERTTVKYTTIERGDVLVRLDQKIAEVRGSSRFATRFRRILMNLTDIVAEPLFIDKDTRRAIYDRLIKPTEAPPKPLEINVEHIVYSDIEKKELRQAEFRGDKLQHKAEVGHYGRMYGGTISKFTGIFIYPSNTPYKTAINYDTSSVMVYKTSDGILTKDLRWITSMLIEGASQ
ncbi:MAG: hypothetical protein JW779_13655 [Candidatus Thorarchaeota archaeon]|nr:hypothetical protein [Candidatus Thorarchaeota archaeon]